MQLYAVSHPKGEKNTVTRVAPRVQHPPRASATAPEPCNWGTSWWDFKHWALDLEALPFTPAEIGFNYNQYLKLGKDVQSP